MGKSRETGSSLSPGLGNEGFRPPRDPHGLVEKGVVILPSGKAPYHSQKRLLDEIKAFIHRYADVAPFWEELIAHYALMSWVFDRFSAVPYLRFLNEHGTGKSRLLQVGGHLSYKGIFAGGATTSSAVFRLVDSWGGTLIIDEADFKNSAAWVDIVKILNNGYMRGFPVTKSEQVRGRYEPRAFDVFGPKIIANRLRFDDPALESRCLTLIGEERKLRDDIPLQLPPKFFEEAEKIRNKLLSYRFENFDKIEIDESKVRHLEPRQAQIATPISSISGDAGFQERFLAFLSRSGAEERSERPQAVVVEAIQKLVQVSNLVPGDSLLTVKAVTEQANKLIEIRGMGEALTPKRVGGMIRALGFNPKRKEDGYKFLPDRKRLTELAEKYVPKSDESGSENG